MLFLYGNEHRHYLRGVTSVKRSEIIPVGVRQSFRVNDQNSCDQNPTGAVTRNVLANDVTLVQNTTTPGSGDEPGFAFFVSSSARVTQ
jgi:hypothetical protein